VRTYKIAAIPGDGIGKEVVGAGLEVLKACAARDGGFALDVTHFDWSSERYKKTGALMPANGVETLKSYDAILFGAVGAPDVPDHVTLWGLRLAICQSLDQYANVRPTRILNGIQSPLRDVRPQDIDWVIIRENSEGEYSGHGGRSHRGSNIEVATEVSVFTRAGVERIMHFAFDMARSRPRKLLTVVTKSNAQRFGMVLWDEAASLDTIVATNLHADILSDLAAALTGSIGLAPTANLNPERRFPSMFEPIHGSAFDIAGKGIANPLATFWSAVMMLDHLGEAGASQRLMAAIERAAADPALHTPDLGGRANTRDVTDAVLGFVRGQND
jgi:tartrate dehydrogenase/decarboxylase/D-malate dehydrogenase